MRYGLPLLLLFFGIALAQGVPDPATFDFANWFVDAAKLAAGIVAIIAALRRYVWKTLDGEAVALVAIGLGLVVSVLGYVMHQFPADWTLFGALGYGLTAGIGAIGIVEGTRAATNRQTLK